MHLVSLLLLLATAPDPAADTALVCPRALRPAMQEWIDYRQRQGRRIALVDGELTSEEIRGRIRRLARPGSLRAVVLVGDADVADARMRARSVPAHYAEAKVNVRWGSEPEIATDNWYADLDDDHVPELAIGRLSADSPEELAVVVRKILAYERAGADEFAGQRRGSLRSAYPASATIASAAVHDDLWRRRINLVAGLGGFGALADAALEAAAKSILTEGIPPTYATTMTQAAWRSPYCPPPGRFGETAVARLNEGCLFWVYLGHGHPWALDRVHFPDGEHEIFTIDQAPRLKAQACPPIALFLACYTGAFDARRDCLAEALLRAAGGPVAIISGSRVTMPYGMSVLGIGLLDECFVKRRETLGDVLLYAKRSMALDPRTDDRKKSLDALAALLTPAGADLADERIEHLHLFNLLGDPLLRLTHPAEVKLDVNPTASGGQLLAISGESPVAGQALIELVVRRDRLAFRPPSRAAYQSSAESDQEYLATYQRANDGQLASARVPVCEGRFQTALNVPDDARGACHVRVFVQGDGQYAAGAADVQVSAAKRSERSAP
ncbi:MAG TPA: C25 family cysteine peptidase [Pirellulales bacterium]|nr:C25 family cysteine peptidase [Pirellulales bacterium]